MSNPRYIPRMFAVTPRLFGQQEKLDWVDLEPDADARTRAHRSAAKTQHQISYGVQSLYMPHSDQATITALASKLEVPYDRLHKVLSGRAVMQLEDIGRLREVVGAELDEWFLRDNLRQAVRIAKAQIESVARRQAEDRARGHRAG
ncbi:hypothetical protein [Microbacterium sp. NPDC089696]|uniref:hypothetical protein n=1 Tax=Microbacterium sp. NPDC089696 TaxID=3364199 RepID=UPI00382BF88C